MKQEMREHAVPCFCSDELQSSAAHFAQILAAERVLTQFELLQRQTVFMRLVAG